MLKQQILFIVIIALLFSSTHCLIALVNASTTKTYYPIYDSYVSSTDGDINSNFGGKSHLEASCSTNMFIGVQNIYLLFNINSIPSNAIIESAYLYLHTSFVTETHEIGVHYCPNNLWKEYEICWANSPPFVEEEADSILVAKDDTLYKWTVKSIINNMNGSEQLLSLVLKSEKTHETGWVWFYSRDQEYSWMEQYRPFLKICYTTPSTAQDTSDIQETFAPLTQDSNITTKDVSIVIIIGVMITGIIAFLIKRNQINTKNEKLENNLKHN